jgi:hypothetical protein
MDAMQMPLALAAPANMTGSTHPCRAARFSAHGH